MAIFHCYVSSPEGTSKLAMAHDFPYSNGLTPKGLVTETEKTVAEATFFSVRGRWVLIDLVVQWGDYLKKKIWIGGSHAFYLS